jgi:ribulose-phosphate 3-epimerase
MQIIHRRGVPAILTDSPLDFTAMIRKAEQFADWVQIDIMDGLFVPSRSITSGDIIKNKPGIAWEAHLMVQEPGKYLDGFIQAGAQRIVVHYEAVKDCILDIVEHIKGNGIEAGLAINPETSIDVLSPQITERIDSVLFLSVHPGFYGAKFIPEVLEKISLFKGIHPYMKVGIDGGVKAANISQIAASGADEICVGSAVFAQPDPAASFKELSSLAKTGWDKQSG